jgi:hypothetical protein
MISKNEARRAWVGACNDSFLRLRRRRRGGGGRVAGGHRQSGGQRQTGQQVPAVHQHQLQHRAVGVRGQQLGRVGRGAGAAAGAVDQTQAAGRAEGAARKLRQLALQPAVGHHRGRARLAAGAADDVALAQPRRLAGQLDDGARRRRPTPRRPGRRQRGAR